jgi:hypothetical protein
MPVLMIRCPNTGREVSTGLNLDAKSFASLPDKLVTTNCPMCGLDHTWLKCDARFVEGDMWAPDVAKVCR